MSRKLIISNYDVLKKKKVCIIYFKYINEKKEADL